MFTNKGKQRGADHILVDFRLNIYAKNLIAAFDNALINDLINVFQTYLKILLAFNIRFWNEWNFLNEKTNSQLESCSIEEHFPFCLIFVSTMIENDPINCLKMKCFKIKQNSTHVWPAYVFSVIHCRKSSVLDSV